MSLLIQAKESTKSKNRIDITPEIEELAIAWAQGEVENIQLQKVLNRPHSNVIYIMGLALKKAMQEGRLTYKNNYVERNRNK